MLFLPYRPDQLVIAVRLAILVLLVLVDRVRLVYTLPPVRLVEAGGRAGTKRLRTKPHSAGKEDQVPEAVVVHPEHELADQNTAKTGLQADPDQPGGLGVLHCEIGLRPQLHYHHGENARLPARCVRRIAHPERPVHRADQCRHYDVQVSLLSTLVLRARHRALQFDRQTQVLPNDRHADAGDLLDYSRSEKRQQRALHFPAGHVNVRQR